MGVLGTFESSDFRSYARDQRVICRTERGLEWGVVVCHLQPDEYRLAESRAHGDLLRPTTPEDEMIIERLDRFKDRAFEACRKRIAERALKLTLVDVEHLFDGESLFFYFLGVLNSQSDEVTAELAELYDSKVRFKKFAESLSQGCGPTCGTGESQCGSSGCGSCALLNTCGAQTTAR